MIRALAPRGLAALELAQEYGFAVFPVFEARARNVCSCPAGARCERVGKHPRIADGFKSASTHPEQIAAWWDRAPDANIGLYPGSAQVIVFDVDGPRGADVARVLGIDAVSTLEVITQRGAHRYFRLPSGVKVGNVRRDELDIRAHAGYVLAPPSVHASGHLYEWRGDRSVIAPLPTGVLEQLSPSARAHPSAPPRLSSRGLASPDSFRERRILRYAERLGFGLSDGRKTGAYRLAAFLIHDIGLSENAALAYVVRWDEHNAPPLGARAITSILDNAHRYGGQRRAA